MNAREKKKRERLGELVAETRELSSKAAITTEDRQAIRTNMKEIKQITEDLDGVGVLDLEDAEKRCSQPLSEPIKMDPAEHWDGVRGVGGGDMSGRITMGRDYRSMFPDVELK